MKTFPFTILISAPLRGFYLRSLPILVTLAAAFMFLAGCATKPPPKAEPTFFPPAPNEPRIQFLTSFSSEADIGSGGKFAEFVTGKSRAENPLVKPYGIAAHKGKIYVCDTMVSAVEVFDFVEKRTHYMAPGGEGIMQTPINISIDSDGTRYVADTGRGQVLLYKPNDEYITAIGVRDEMRPTDVAVTQDRIYVTDLKTHVVRVYSKVDRKQLFTIPRDPKTAEKKLLSPTNIAIDPQGRVVISDTGAFAVQVFDSEGKYIRTIGQQGVAPGLFARPKGIATDRAGRIYIADAATQVIQLFDADGKLLMFFGQPQSSREGAVNLPAAVKVDYDNVDLFKDKVAPGFACEYLIFATSQVGNNKVNVYGFVKKLKGSE